MSETKREKIKRQIQALLDKADSTSFDAERDAILEKVDTLMMAYTIEEWELEKEKKAKGLAADVKPDKTSVFISGPDNPLELILIDLASAIARHTRCQIVYHGANSKYSDTKATIFGFPSDLDYFSTLFTSLHIQMARQLEPKPDSQLSWIENLVMLKEAGQKWQRIHTMLAQHDGYPYKDQGWVRAIGVRFTKVYSDYCKDNAREQFKTSPITWQKNFAQAYVNEISNRFYEIRKQNAYTGTMALAVRDRTEEVSELLVQTYPKLGNLKRSANGKFDGAAYRAGKQAGAAADISGGRGSMGNASRGSLPQG